MLVVDDDESYRAAAVTLLRAEGFSVVEAANGRAALDYLFDASVLPKVILLDLNMPVMSGRETIEVLRSDLRFAKIPIVVVTAEAIPSVPRHASVVATLSKLASVDRLIALVRQYASPSKRLA